MTLDTLLDAAKSAKGITTDMALADALGVTRASVSNWRHGRNLPDEVQCARIADLAGVPVHRVVGMVGEARALTKEAKAVWRRVANAAALALALALGTYLPTPAEAASGSSRASGVGYIMRTIKLSLAEGWPS